MDCVEAHALHTSTRPSLTGGTHTIFPDPVPQPKPCYSGDASNHSTSQIAKVAPTLEDDRANNENKITTMIAPVPPLAEEDDLSSVIKAFKMNDTNQEPAQEKKEENNKKNNGRDAHLISKLEKNSKANHLLQEPPYQSGVRERGQQAKHKFEMNKVVESITTWGGKIANGNAGAYVRTYSSVIRAGLVRLQTTPADATKNYKHNAANAMKELDILQQTYPDRITFDPNFKDCFDRVFAPARTEMEQYQFMMECIAEPLTVQGRYDEVHRLLLGLLSFLHDISHIPDQTWELYAATVDTQTSSSYQAEAGNVRRIKWILQVQGGGSLSHKLLYNSILTR